MAHGWGLTGSYAAARGGGVPFLAAESGRSKGGVRAESGRSPDGVRAESGSDEALGGISRYLGEYLGEIWGGRSGLDVVLDLRVEHVRHLHPLSTSHTPHIPSSFATPFLFQEGDVAGTRTTRKTRMGCEGRAAGVRCSLN